MYFSTSLHSFSSFDSGLRNRQSRSIEYDQLIEGMMRLAAAQDVVTELLERFTNSNKYDPWGESIGKKARFAWEKKNGAPFQKLREYRNHLIHGRVVPLIRSIAPNNMVAILVPAIGRVSVYLDWRNLTGEPRSLSAIGTDFVPSNSILDDAWSQTIQYFERTWRDYLL